MDSFRSRQGCNAIIQNNTNVAMKIIRKLTEPELKIVENINRLMIEYEVREREKNPSNRRISFVPLELDFRDLRDQGWRGRLSGQNLNRTGRESYVQHLLFNQGFR